MCMKKIYILALAAILLGAGCNPTTPGPHTPPVQTVKNTSTYHNGTYGFSFLYPNDFVFVTPAYPTLEDKIAQLQTPRDAYPHTNFGDAAFSVSAVYAKSMADCLKNQMGMQFNKTHTINGQEFYSTTSSDAGAGNVYESKVYRTLAGNQTCVEFQETIHTTNIGNYPEGTVTEVQKNPIWEKLDAIAESFTFDKN